MPSPVRVGISLGRRQRSQERQSPDAPGPGDLRQDHDREPAQAARLDEMAMAGAGWIAVNSAGGNLGTPASLQRVVQADNDGPARNEGADQQAKQASCGLAAGPTAAIKYAVIVGEMRILVQTSNAKRGCQGPASGAEHGTDQQHQHTPPGWGGKHVPERLHLAGELHLRRLEHPTIRHIDPGPKFGIDSPSQFQP